MKQLLYALALLGLLADPAAAQAPCPPPSQSTPNFSAGGNLFGRTAPQWNTYFAAKVDANNGTLCNVTFTGTLHLTGAQVTSALGYVPLDPGKNLSELSNSAAARTALGLGTLATQNAAAVAIIGGTITGLPNPVNAADAANKAYVDLTAVSLVPQQSVQWTTNAVLPNSPTYANGTAGVGATLTANANNIALVVDVNTVALNDRVLVKNQATGFQNGAYFLSQLADASHPWILTRVTDWDTAAEMKTDSYFFTAPNSGGVNGTTSWFLQTAQPIVPGTTALVFNQFSQSQQYQAGTGISLVANVFSLAATTGSGASVLATNPTFTAALTALGQGSLLGTNVGNRTSPTTSNTNLLLYNLSGSNWAGIGVDAGGNVYHVTGTSSPATRLTILATGQVGINNTSPGSTLTVGGNVDATSGAAYLLAGVTAHSRQTNYHVLTDYDANQALFLGGGADHTNYYRNSNHNWATIGGATALMQLSSSVLNVSVGSVTMPSAALAVGTSSVGCTCNITFGSTSTGLQGNAGAMNLRVSGNSALSLTTTSVVTNTAFGVGVVPSGISMAVDNPGSGFVGGPDALNILTSSITRMNITGSWIVSQVNFGVGLIPSHQIQLLSNDGFKPGGGSWGDSSDARLKTNLVYGFDALDQLRRVRPALYDWRNPGTNRPAPGEVGRPSAGGFVAQDLREVFPDFVSSAPCAGEDCRLTGNDAVLGVDLPFKFDAYLVRAIQQLDDRLLAVERRGRPR